MTGEHPRSVTYHEIMRLKQTYGVSAAAMLMRLRQVGVLSEAAVEYAFRTYARKWRTVEPEPIKEGEGFAAFEAPQRFQRLVWRALGEELISPVRAAQMLGLPLNIIEREIRGPREH
jgi:Zn-dependent peptidase ImmA (M78 family)